VAAPTECDDFGGTNRDSVVASVPTASGGSCQSSGGNVDLVDPSWATAHRLCAGAPAPGGGCSTAGDVCVRQPTAPFATTWCIMTTGDVPCPASDYTERTLVYTGVDDTRGCTSCSCDAPSGVACGLVTTVYSNVACTMDAQEVQNDGTSCVANSGMRSARYSVSSGPSGGSCTPSGVAPSGSATPASARTVCCQL
jgi:hypothetical protein